MRFYFLAVTAFSPGCVERVDATTAVFFGFLGSGGLVSVLNNSACLLKTLVSLGSEALRLSSRSFHLEHE